jgi:hypothetical protein
LLAGPLLLYAAVLSGSAFYRRPVLSWESSKADSDVRSFLDADAGSHLTAEGQHRGSELAVQASESSKNSGPSVVSSGKGKTTVDTPDSPELEPKSSDQVALDVLNDPAFENFGTEDVVTIPAGTETAILNKSTLDETVDPAPMSLASLVGLNSQFISDATNAARDTVSNTAQKLFIPNEGNLSTLADTINKYKPMAKGMADKAKDPAVAKLMKFATGNSKFSDLIKAIPIEKLKAQVMDRLENMTESESEQPALEDLISHELSDVIHRAGNQIVPSLLEALPADNRRRLGTKTPAFVLQFATTIDLFRCDGPKWGGGIGLDLGFVYVLPLACSDAKGACNGYTDGYWVFTTGWNAGLERDIGKLAWKSKLGAAVAGGTVAAGTAAGAITTPYEHPTTPPPTTDDELAKTKKLAWPAKRPKFRTSVQGCDSFVHSIGRWFRWMGRRERPAPLSPDVTVGYPSKAISLGFIFDHENAWGGGWGLSISSNKLPGLDLGFANIKFNGVSLPFYNHCSGGLAAMDSVYLHTRQTVSTFPTAGGCTTSRGSIANSVH